MPSTKDLVIGSKLNCLFKGDVGCGKTIAAASFPEPFFFDFDGRMAPVANWYGQKDIQYENYFNNFRGAMSKLENLISYNPYGTIVIDSLTSFARTIMTMMIRTRVSGEKGKPGIQRGGIDVAQIEDYGGETAAIVQTLDAFRALKSHTILIAHVISVEERDLKTKAITQTRSLLTGGKKIAAEIPIYFDEAYHFHVRSDFSGNGQYLVTTKNTGVDWAKTALSIPQEIDWTGLDFYSNLLELMKSGSTQDSK